DFMYTLKMQGNKHSRSVGRYRWDLEDRYSHYLGYEDLLEYYKKEVNEVERMLTQIREFVPKDEMQAEFLNEIEKEVLKLCDKIQKPEKPEKETKEEARIRILAEIEEVKKEIRKTERIMK